MSYNNYKRHSDYTEELDQVESSNFARVFVSTVFPGLPSYQEGGRQ